MAPYIPVPNVLQCNVRYTSAGQLMENVLHFEFNTDFKTAADVLYGYLGSAFWPTLRSALSVQLVSNGVYMVDLSTSSGGVESYPPFDPAVGLSSIAAAPNNVAYVVTHRTAKRGKSYRGRTYVVGFPIDKVGNSLLSTDSRDSVVSAFNDLRTAAAADGLNFVIVSKYQNGAPLTTGIATPVTVSEGRDLALDSQRRRLPTRGT